MFSFCFQNDLVDYDYDRTSPNHAFSLLLNNEDKTYRSNAYRHISNNNSNSGNTNNNTSQDYENGHLIMKGYIRKYSNFFARWQQRYFELIKLDYNFDQDEEEEEEDYDENYYENQQKKNLKNFRNKKNRNTLKLLYYTIQSDESNTISQKPRGFIMIDESSLIETPYLDARFFTIKSKNCIFYLKALNEVQQYLWTRTILTNSKSKKSQINSLMISNYHNNDNYDDNNNNNNNNEYNYSKNNEATTSCIFSVKKENIKEVDDDLEVLSQLKSSLISFIKRGVEKNETSTEYSDLLELSSSHLINRFNDTFDKLKRISKNINEDLELQRSNKNHQQLNDLYQPLASSESTPQSVLSNSKNYEIITSLEMREKQINNCFQSFTNSNNLERCEENIKNSNNQKYKESNESIEKHKFENLNFDTFYDPNPQCSFDKQYQESASSTCELNTRSEIDSDNKNKYHFDDSKNHDEEEEMKISLVLGDNKSKKHLQSKMNKKERIELIESKLKAGALCEHLFTSFEDLRFIIDKYHEECLRNYFEFKENFSTHFKHLITSNSLNGYVSTDQNCEDSGALVNIVIHSKLHALTGHEIVFALNDIESRREYSKDLDERVDLLDTDEFSNAKLFYAVSRKMFLISKRFVTIVQDYQNISENNQNLLLNHDSNKDDDDDHDDDDHYNDDENGNEELKNNFLWSSCTFDVIYDDLNRFVEENDPINLKSKPILAKTQCLCITRSYRSKSEYEELRKNQAKNAPNLHEKREGLITEFFYSMKIDLGGWLPKKAISLAMNNQMPKFTKSLVTFLYKKNSNNAPLWNEN